jgi:hypothetical protein
MLTMNTKSFYQTLTRFNMLDYCDDPDYHTRFTILAILDLFESRPEVEKLQPLFSDKNNCIEPKIMHFVP